MSRGWEDTLDFMMRDPFNTPQRSSRHKAEPIPAEFYEPLDEEHPSKPLSEVLQEVKEAKVKASAGLKKQAERDAEALEADHAWEPGQEHPCSAFREVSIGGLDDTYRMNPRHLCQPISGDATLLKGWHLLE